MIKFFQGVTIVFLLFIIWIIFSANTGGNNIFFEFVNWLPFGDKIGHFFLFGCLTLGVNFAFNFKKFTFWEVLPLGTFLVSVFVLIEELSQGFLPNRTLDVADLLADGLGIVSFTFIGNVLSKKGFFGLRVTNK
ncbi:VanZ family protein [Winogradskyella litoriviva]|uniref:VanZ family protein n=1 Tax=Winogradskyella litoriviva TaxID=1220182 RepID=A0ABX2E4M9_9FLAO|nr:VanZ family protein [Winogradskyella litoriviva]NRD23420.1 VanZ family protein [Winogradskyella litoriviva]